ncbi:hypothetical protein RhiJN_23250 [Ceratobasidium sp. AG-Ba]|nr:hypothetical protein RhiJN_23250 [Ceratobasidium sp. AG-Ba]
MHQKIVLFGVNDVNDYPSDLVNPRKSASSLEGTVLPPAHHSFIYRAAIVSSIFVTIISTLPYFYAPPGISDTWQAWTPTISTIALVAFGWMYSAPPFRLKEIPLVDSTTNSLMCWLMWFTGFSTCYTLSGMSCSLRDVPTVVNALVLVAIGDHALAAAVDLKADTHAGHRTVATFLGIRGCAMVATAAYAAALLMEGFKSIFGVYFAGGLCVVLSQRRDYGWLCKY